MMNALANLFLDIANAIREKTQKTDSLTPAAFPEAIRTITGGGAAAELPRLYAPALTRTGDTLTVQNPAANGAFATEFHIYDGGELHEIISGTTLDLATLPLGAHLLTVQACGELFTPSAHSEVLNAAKHAVSMTLSHVTADIEPTYVWEGDPLTLRLTPEKGYELPANITATVGGTAADVTYDRTEKTLTFPAVTGDVVIAIAAIVPETLEDTPWETIADYASEGTLTSHFALGDTKTVTVTYPQQTSASATQEVTKTFTMEIVGFDHDDLPDGGTAAVSFLCREMAGFYLTGDPTSNNCCWANMNLRTTLNGAILNALPAGLRENIKQVVKQYDDIDENDQVAIYQSQDYLWIPSMQEVAASGGSNTLHTLGSAYDLAYTPRQYTDAAGNVSESSRYITRNQPTNNNDNWYQSKLMFANGTTTTAGNTVQFCFGFCL